MESWFCGYCGSANSPDVFECSNCANLPVGFTLCEICGCTFSSDDIISHSESEHSSADSIPCEMCAKSVALNDYETHVMNCRSEDSEDELPPPKSVCPKCGSHIAIFEMDDHLEMHENEYQQALLSASKEIIPLNSTVGVACRIAEIFRSVDIEVSEIGSIVNFDLAMAFVTKFKEISTLRGKAFVKSEISYHWTPEKNFGAIIESNLKVPDGKSLFHMTDDGWYGRGIYTSPEIDYAKSYGHGARTVICCLVVRGKSYVANYPQDIGCSLKYGFDSHQSQCGKEWVLFDSANLLPCFIGAPSGHRAKERTNIMMDVAELLKNVVMDLED
eukprot:454313_1